MTMTEHKTTSTSPYVGERVSYESALCTVRYIGPVEGTQKDWLGVEWDDPTRGKHDGEHKGVRYFSCRSKSKTSASFIRPSRAADTSCSFVEAVHQKYASEFTQHLLEPREEKLVVISGKVAEEVGFDKIRKQLAQLSELKIVLVDAMKIDHAETDLKKIRDVCPKIVELDLSRNLFTGCREIIKICGELDKLRDLRINGNRLSIVQEDLVEAQEAFRGITNLGLDSMLLPWQEICQLAQQFMSLVTLSASMNEFTSLPMGFIPTSSLSTLTSLTMEHNHFTHLTDLAPLTKLTSLERLLLKGNLIYSISSSEAISLKFPSCLRYVDLSYNVVNSWSFIDRLPDVFPGLTGLRFSHNPIYDTKGSSSASAMSVEEGFMLTLARIANLQFLNFSKIATAERTNAEMFYLSRIGKELAAVPEDEEQKVVQEHRRYKELCELHGEPVIVRATKETINPNFLEARLFRFTLVLPARTVEGQKSEIVKELEIPKGFDVYRVKGIVGRLFGLEPMSMRLVWETGEWDPVAGYEDEEDSDDEGEGKVVEQKGKYMRREVEIEDSTRQVGFCVDGAEARVRIELR